MKVKVSDSAVAEYASRIRAGIPLGKLFPAPMTDCDFTDQQRTIIRQARVERKKSQKASNVTKASAERVSSQPGSPPQSATIALPAIQKPRALTKLRKMLYLQSGRCFFCGELLSEDDASIEHLNPTSRGGAKVEDNEVVCHASLNETFGALDVKRKFEFVLKSAGAFTCPKK